MIPFEGFAPDLPPETPGIFTECANIIPSLGVFVGAPSPIDCGLGALDSAAKGFVVTRNLDDDALVFAGDSAKLYRQGSGVWNDVSKVGGYTLGPDDRWRFAQFGNVTLASCGSSVIQYLDNLGSAFDDAGTAPKAQAIEVINNQVFAFNIDGMGFGSDVTRWGCSAIGDYADWTPSVATQCVSGQLLDTPGPITAGRQLGDVIIAYKERSMYVGQYVGAPVVWDFRRIPGEIGAACQEAVVNTGTAHFFIGPDDFYIYDGSRPQPLNSPCRNWFFNNADQRYMYKTCGTYDRINSRVYWWFASRYSGGNLDKCIVYNIKTNKWGRMDSDIEFVAEYISSGISYDELGSLYVTYDDLPTNISYNSPFWSSGSSVVAVFKPDHTCYQLSGITNDSSYTTGHYGDNMRFSTITRIRPRFIQTPTTSELKYFYSNSDASTFTQNINSTYTNNWYDLLWSARWHKMEFNNTGAIAVSGFDLLMAPDGIE